MLQDWLLPTRNPRLLSQVAGLTVDNETCRSGWCRPGLNAVAFGWADRGGACYERASMSVRYARIAKELE